MNILANSSRQMGWRVGGLLDDGSSSRRQRVLRMFSSLIDKETVILSYETF